jgi:hypothetical protein
MELENPLEPKQIEVKKVTGNNQQKLDEFKRLFGK